MKYRLVPFIGLILIITLIAVPIQARKNNSTIQIEEMYISAKDISLENNRGFTKTGEGLTITEGQFRKSYLSASIQAPFPFNAVATHWKANIPTGSNIEIALRTGHKGIDWSEWTVIEPSLDWTTEKDEFIVGDMLAVSALDIQHQFLQYRITFERHQSSADPALQELQLIFIDSSDGPSVQEMKHQQRILDASLTTEQSYLSETYPKPFVISRDVWCTDPRCDYSNGLEYQPVTHLILHHTVSGSNGDPAALMRAIWAYHTITRGWGDIGYNYLTDTDGTLFEGHLGGDDVVGIHARQANAGSMALALMGTYSTADPPPDMVEAVVDLFSWKADQKGIDVFQSSDTLPDVGYGLPHLMGHRDVEGTTQCPGNHAHALLPTIKEEVGRRIGLESPYLYVDELSDSFIKSDANWYTASLQCGHNSHAWYTWSTTDPVLSTNWGEWRPQVPADGRYQIDAHIPYCNTGASETRGSYYQIQHANGSSAIEADQNSHVGLWMPLGEFDLRAGTGNVIRLTDLTTTDDTLGVWFDSLRLLKLETFPSAVLQSPTDGSLTNERSLIFDWTIENPQVVTKTTFQVALDQEFQIIISVKEWPSVIESVSHTFDQDYGILYWRIILTTDGGDNYTSLPVQFGIDTQPPVSSINRLWWFEWRKQYQLFWQGEDQISGIQNYTVEYLQIDGEGEIWQTLVTNSEETSAIFNPPTPTASYLFRIQAQDKLGNVEDVHQTPDISSEQAISFPHVIILPAITAD